MEDSPIPAKPGDITECLDRADVQNSIFEENQATCHSDGERGQWDPLAPSDCSEKEDSSRSDSGNRRGEQSPPRRNVRGRSAPLGERSDIRGEHRTAPSSEDDEEPQTKYIPDPVAFCGGRPRRLPQPQEGQGLVAEALCTPGGKDLPHLPPALPQHQGT